MQALVLRAGAEARRRIEAEGLSPALFSHLGAAAGGPKWLIASRLDRAIFGTWLAGRTAPLVAVGASIGSWRLACAAQRDPVAAFDRFERAYLSQRYSLRPTARDVGEQALAIVRALLGEHGAHEIATHPWLQLNIVVARCQGWAGSDNGWLARAGLAGAALANAGRREWLGRRIHRGLVHSGPAAVALAPDGFPTHTAPLSAANLVPALMASAAIPGVMPAVRALPGLPDGCWIDGGLVDYHMDLPLAGPEGLMLLPHYGERVTTGWLDKHLPWRRARHLSRTLVLAPSPAVLATLPRRRIPDRGDFWRYAGRDAARERDWRRALDAGARMADDFLELAARGDVAARLQPLA